jgi:hypothetical protein
VAGEVRSHRPENLVRYVVMDARQRIGNLDAAEVLWSTLAESYVEGGCELHVHFRAGTVEGRIVGDWCAVFNREVDWLDFLGSNAVGDKIGDGSQGKHHDMRQAVLVHYGKPVELPEGIVPELLSSVVRLLGLDFCLGGWRNPPKHLKEFLQVLASEDGELGVSRYFARQRPPLVSDGKLEGEVVEGGAEVVEAVPDNEAKVSWRRVEDFDPIELASAIGIVFGPRSIRAFFKPGVPFRFKAVQVIERPLQPSYMVESHGNGSMLKDRAE